jgi:fumarylacetoacetate (FAA) hydrolase
MKLVTMKSESPDGRLALVNRDATHAVTVADLYPNLQAALEDWGAAKSALQARADALDAGALPRAFPFEARAASAPLPRSYQWLDGSAYRSHGDLMSRVFKIDNPQTERPLMYQGLSHEFLGPTDDVVLPSESDDIDFEGEFGIVTDRVPMATTVEAAAEHICLIVQINDWSLRSLAPIEMKTGFGWIQAKPACSMAPIAVTPDELGSDWQLGRVALTLKISWNDRPFGAARGEAMEFGFPELVAHAARTRGLCAGTIIGSGTVSNDDFRDVGSSCIAERRAVELLDTGAPNTPYMRFGDKVRMEALTRRGLAPFGAIEQRVVALLDRGC